MCRHVLSILTQKKVRTPIKIHLREVAKGREEEAPASLCMSLICKQRRQSPDVVVFLSSFNHIVDMGVESDDMCHFVMANYAS